MKFIVEDVSEYKRVVNIVTALASKKVVSTNEQCVLLEVQSDVLTFTALETGSHKISFDFPINPSTSQSGKALILASKLKNITSKLVPKTVVSIETSNGLLKYSVKPHGSISETLYHDQSGFSSPLMNDDLNDSTDFIEVTLSSDLVPLLLPIVCANTYSGKSIFFKTSAQFIEIYSQFSETGYIKYQTVTESFQTQNCQIYLKPNLVKIVGNLNKEVDILYSKENKMIKFVSENGNLSIIGDTPTTNQSNTVEQILSQPVKGEVVVNHADLIISTNWQGYNVENQESIELSIENNELVIQCSKNNEPARIVTEGVSNFQPMTLSLTAFQLALKSIGNAKSNILPIIGVSLKQRIIPIGKDEIKLLSLSPSDEPDSFATAIMYETRILSK